MFPEFGVWMSMALSFGIATPMSWYWFRTRSDLSQYREVRLCIGWNWAEQFPARVPDAAPMLPSRGPVDQPCSIPPPLVKLAVLSFFPMSGVVWDPLLLPKLDNGSRRLSSSSSSPATSHMRDSIKDECFFLESGHH
jgi:hypothetical protein